MSRCNRPLQALTGLFLAMTPGGAGADTRFVLLAIDTQGPEDSHAKTLADIDGDGFLDAIVAGTDGEIVWYEYPKWPKWRRHTVTESGGTWTTDIEAADIDNDGDSDIVASDQGASQRIVWWRNPGNGTGEWTLNVIGSPAAHDIEVGDMDGDGDVDVATRDQGDRGDQVVVWRQNARDSWTQGALRTPAGEGLHLGDVDADADLDVIIGGRWFENDGDIIGGTWRETQFAPSWREPEGFPWMADINKDGRMDIAIVPTESAGSYYRVSWFEGPVDPSNSNWSERIVDDPVETVLHSIALGDMNNDGRTDLVTAEMHQGSTDEVRIYYSLDDLGTRWSKQVISTSASHNLRVGDVGNDGDLDILGTNWTGDATVYLWINQTNAPE